jgi:polyisoprenoid-binding protein YceI
MSVLTAARTATWSLDPVHSTIGFELPYLAGTFRGQFTDVEATFGAGRLTGSARVASVVVKDENLTAHLQSPDFFDAERHPELRFESDEIEESDGRLVVSGDITIRGVTKPVELAGTISEPFTDAFGQERLGLQLETTVDRTEFGLNWNMPLPSGDPSLPNDVKLVADLYFVRQA